MAPGEREGAGPPAATALVGIAAGISLLVNLARGHALLALGVFVTLYGACLLTARKEVDMPQLIALLL